MKFLRLLIVLLSAGVLLTAVGLYDPAAVAAQDKQQTTQTDGSKTDTTTTGFPTGTTCAKTGIYHATNKYLEVIIVVEDGEVFPPFTDGQKTTWYALGPSTKDSFDSVKVSPGSN
ncbi:MAG TPA: hypothetical protein VGJ37_09785 [Pyrinomonadaceae bacterium]|jgi:hypothetical protein